MRASVAGLAFGVLFAGSAFGQYVISAHSGTIQYVEGTAYLNNEKVEPRSGQFPEIRETQVFRTEEGRAEVLLTPGVFLRLDETSSIQMVSSKLTDTQVEVLTGSAMVECDDLAKDNAITLRYKGNNILLMKHGLYRVDAEQGLLKVYDGEAVVKGASSELTLHKGKEAFLNGGALVAQNFDVKADDDLYRWSDRRSGYLAKANVSSANSMVAGYPTYGGIGGFGYGGYGCSGFGMWQFNPMFGMNTYIPCTGSYFSPFGYGFYSPFTVWQAPYNYGGGGITGISRNGSGSGKHTPLVPSRGVGAVASARGGNSSGAGARGSAPAASSGFSASSAGHASSGGGASGGGHGH